MLNYFVWISEEAVISQECSTVKDTLTSVAFGKKTEESVILSKVHRKDISEQNSAIVDLSVIDTSSMDAKKENHNNINVIQKDINMKLQKSVEYSDVSNTPIIQTCASTIGTCSETVRIVLSVKKEDKNGNVFKKSIVKYLVPVDKQKSKFGSKLNEAELF